MEFTNQSESFNHFKIMLVLNLLGIILFQVFNYTILSFIGSITFLILAMKTRSKFKKRLDKILIEDGRLVGGNLKINESLENVIVYVDKKKNKVYRIDVQNRKYDFEVSNSSQFISFFKSDNVNIKKRTSISLLVLDFIEIINPK
ncbi:MAG: hypothetical protein N4A45_12795 [Flavobacteriales bacterium]|jgi:hypothetical protein|nr:hypothetical protein [Flavobacteriales bacterium]